MNENLPILPVYGRKATQQRSINTQRKIVAAAIDIAAQQGIAGLTHRVVAQRAGVSLAATTYYYKTKSDIIADVSNTLNNGYVEMFSKTNQRMHRYDVSKSRPHWFAFRLLQRATKSKRTSNIAWMEILLNQAHHNNNRQLTRQWAQRIEQVWSEVTHFYNDEKPDEAARSEIDMTVGFSLMILALELTEQDVVAVFYEHADPFHQWARPEPAGQLDENPKRRITPKAKLTRRRILDETISILIEQGASAVNFRLIAKRAQLTPAAPSYYFSSPRALLREAQTELFERSKTRYRDAMGTVDYHNLQIENLIDLTTTVFSRESTESGALNFANYGIWLEASRTSELRPLIWTAINDQAQAWHRILSVFNANSTPLDAFLIQAIYIGKLIRIVGLGSASQDLAQVRKEFSNVLNSLVTSGKI
ncbi:MAG: TetR family transcriptional regulator [Alphaproteobacteria bacterium]|nr:TetR family transcriptional regulator [Alphaproteobacteria bacterium]